MAARSIWSGVLGLGLVSLPVGLYSATSTHTTHFHQIQRGTSDRVRTQRVNQRTGKQVDYGDIVKGFGLDDGEYVVVEPDELDAIAPIFDDRTYYLAPRGEPYKKVYELLRQALRDSGRVGVATFVMRGKQYLVALRGGEDVITLETLHWADEVRDPTSELDLPRHTKPAANEAEMARQLIDAMAIDWEPGKHSDTYEERVRELIETKAKGGAAEAGLCGGGHRPRPLPTPPGGRPGRRVMPGAAPPGRTRTRCRAVDDAALRSRRRATAAVIGPPP